MKKEKNMKRILLQVQMKMKQEQELKDGLMYEPEIEGIVVNGVRINQDLADALCGTLDFDESDSENMFYYFNMKYIDEEIYNAYKGPIDKFIPEELKGTFLGVIWLIYCHKCFFVYWMRKTLRCVTTPHNFNTI